MNNSVINNKKNNLRKFWYFSSLLLMKNEREILNVQNYPFCNNFFDKNYV